MEPEALHITYDIVVEMPLKRAWNGGHGNQTRGPLYIK